MAEYKTILLDKKDGVATVTFNRPEKKVKGFKGLRVQSAKFNVEHRTLNELWSFILQYAKT